VQFKIGRKNTNIYLKRILPGQRMSAIILNISNLFGIFDQNTYLCAISKKI